jgi:catechol 2,3-dioxygenase-like lactoylglutathione lyase family enzyme
MMAALIEHVNITVGNPERTAQMLETLFGWQIRWQGLAASGGYTIHIGTETQYLAIYADAGSDGTPLHHRKGLPLNHIGIHVDDLDAVETRAVALGLIPCNHGDYEPGRRFYIFDPDGIEYEIVSYSPNIRIGGVDTSFASNQTSLV